MGDELGARRGQARFVWVAVAIAVALSMVVPEVAGGSVAGSHAPDVGAPASARLTALGRSGGPGVADTIGEVAARARDEGSVRVIVTLDVPFTPEATLRASRMADQRERIAEAGRDLLRRLAGSGARPVRLYETLPHVVLDLTPSGVDALRRAPGVEQVREDGWLRPHLGDTTFDTGAVAANASGYDGRGTAIAIIDSGVDFNHEFLRDRVIAQACFSVNRSCPNRQRTQSGTGAARACSFAKRACKHGTHVAGIAAGRHANGPQYDGVAPRARVIAVQVFSRLTGSLCVGAGESPCAAAAASDVIAALEWVYLKRSMGVVAVNLSLGSGWFQNACDWSVFKPAIDQLRGARVASVVASGNAGMGHAMSEPACVSSAVAVGATNGQDRIAPFSNASSGLDLLAPGVDVSSAVPGGGYTEFDGTSMAAPHVAGAFAVARQRWPDKGVAWLLDRLRDYALPVRDDRNKWVFGRLDLAAALGVPPVPGPPRSVNVYAGDTRALVTWRAPAEGAGLDAYFVTAIPGGPTVRVSGAATRAVLAGLANGTAYSVVVRGSVGGRRGVASAPRRFEPTSGIIREQRLPIDDAQEIFVDQREDRVFVSGGRRGSGVTALSTRGGFERYLGISGASGFAALGDTLFVARSELQRIDRYDRETISYLGSVDTAPMHPLDLEAVAGAVWFTYSDNPVGTSPWGSLGSYDVGSGVVTDHGGPGMSLYGGRIEGRGAPTPMLAAWNSGVSPGSLYLFDLTGGAPVSAGAAGWNTALANGKDAAFSPDGSELLGASSVGYREYTVPALTMSGTSYGSGTPTASVDVTSRRGGEVLIGVTAYSGASRVKVYALGGSTPAGSFAVDGRLMEEGVVLSPDGKRALVVIRSSPAPPVLHVIPLPAP